MEALELRPARPLIEKVSKAEGEHSLQNAADMALRMGGHLPWYKSRQKRIRRRPGRPQPQHVPDPEILVFHRGNPIKFLGTVHDPTTLKEDVSIAKNQSMKAPL